MPMLGALPVSHSFLGRTLPAACLFCHSGKMTAVALVEGPMRLLAFDAAEDDRFASGASLECLVVFLTAVCAHLAHVHGHESAVLDWDRESAVLEWEDPEWAFCRSWQEAGSHVGIKSSWQEAGSHFEPPYAEAAVEQSLESTTVEVVVNADENRCPTYRSW
eukprot:Polyplicarium_translucidae@DN279_c0_g1_i1.p1